MTPASSVFKDPSQAAYFERLRENIELLNGTRGDSINHAVVKGDIEVATSPALTGITATDFINLKTTLDALIRALKG